MTETAPRDEITECVEKNPGIHFNELVRSVSLATGQVQYHMYSLLEDGEVDDTDLYGRTHYYPAEYPEEDRGAVSLLRRETARQVVLQLVENGECRPEEVSDALGIARSTLEWHVGRLVEQNLVEKRHGDDGRVTVSAVDEERTVEMLSDISPSLSDRLVDRFVTMVDRMLEEPR
ncbi:MAG: winged helix-turn-helix transcriptional regulator [Halobacteriales archaeon]|nr:winged helix-turn-helix transcriptional regulator [Halobacteriales archaeon]